MGFYNLIEHSDTVNLHKRLHKIVKITLPLFDGNMSTPSQYIPAFKQTRFQIVEEYT